MTAQVQVYAPGVTVEVVARPPVVVVPPSNVALASAGGVASASSTYLGCAASALIDGERTGANWPGSGWANAAPPTYPHWVQVNFSGDKTINRVVVYSLQDSLTASIEPMDTLTFTKYGIVDFSVQVWNGMAWETVGAPVVGNNLVKRAVGFTAVSTTRIRINATKAVDGHSRLVEVEAWSTTDAVGTQPAYVAPTFSGPLVAGAPPLAMTVGVAVALAQYVSGSGDVTWMPFDLPAIASLTPAGLLTAKSAGNFSLTVEVDDGH